MISTCLKIFCILIAFSNNNQSYLQLELITNRAGRKPITMEKKYNIASGFFI